MADQTSDLNNVPSDAGSASPDAVQPVDVTVQDETIPDVVVLAEEPDDGAAGPGQSGASEQGAAQPNPSDQIRVGIKDDPTSTVRNPSDLMGVVGYVLGIIIMGLAVIYAHNTTEGMAADVRAFAVLLQRILFVPVAVLDMAVILVPPIAVTVDLLIRRHPTTLLQGLIGAVTGVVFSILLVFTLDKIGPEALVTGLAIRQEGVLIVTIPAYVAAIVALLTAVASPARRASVRWSWNLLWVAVVVSVVTTTTSLPGMVIAIFIGRAAGYGARYAVGVASQRAYGLTLLDGIRRAGFSPLTIDRVPSASTVEAQTSVVGVQTPQFLSEHRLYVMQTLAGGTYNVIVLDGDRQVMGILSSVWTYLRSRGIEGRNTLSLRQTAERAAVLTYTARSAGVSTPAIVAIAEAEDSMLLIRQATMPSVSFADLSDDQITDDLLDAMWAQLGKAHRCGIAHRALTLDVFRIDQDTEDVWLLGWESGDVAASDLAIRMDRTQMVSLIAAKVGASRALASATRALPTGEVAALGPLLQVPAVPKTTRSRMHNPKDVLAQLRAELTQDMPEAEIQPIQIARVGARTVIMIVLVAVVIIAALTSFNLTEIVQALTESDWRWAVAAFVVGMGSMAGQALVFLAFSPAKLSYWKAVCCQIAAAFVALAAPAGLGPAAVNLRVLTKKNVPTPLAAATVALIQVSQVVVTILALVIVTVVTGSNQWTSFRITPPMLIVIGVLAALIGGAFAWPRSRTWILARVMPMLRQTWPRLVELLSNPARLALGVVGNLIAILAYVTAMQWAVYAFGQDIPYLAAALVYLLGNSAGAFIPTPGGMGAIEVTESGALVTLGLNAGVAASIVLLFRLVSYWIRIPLGWVAYRFMRRVGEL